MNNTKQSNDTVLTKMKQAIVAAQAGNMPLARLNLERLVASECNNPSYWLWVAWTADSPTASVSALEQALTLDPHYDLAQQGLAWAQSMQRFDPTAYAKADLSHEVTLDDQHAAEVSERTDHVAATEDELDWPGLEELQSVQDEVSRDTSTADEFDHDDQIRFDTEALVVEEPAEQGSEDSTSEPRNGVEFPVETIDGSDQVDELADEQLSEEVEDAAEPTAEEIDELSSETLQTLDQLRDSIEETCSAVDEDSQAADVNQPESVDDVEEIVVAEQVEFDEDVVVAEEVELQEDGQPDSTDGTPLSDDSAERLVVLAVDDSPTIRKIVSMSLERLGYQVITAADGKEALQQMTQHTPSLVLTDISMPQIDGYQLCKLIKSHESTKAIPVIMLSGKDGMFDKMKGKFVGCDDYITKPFQSNELLDKVASYLPLSVSDS